MTQAIVGLVAAYVLLGVLLLSLNLRSAWHWLVKAGAIATTTGAAVAVFLVLEAMLGWPTEAAPPARFRLHAALVEEPDERNAEPGAIYLWLSPKDGDGAVSGPPRAYALPYSRELHEQTAQARRRMEDGRRVDGATAKRPDGRSPYGSRGVRVDLFEAPVAQLPPKNAG